jgi:general secretion pathway protein C
MARQPWLRRTMLGSYVIVFTFMLAHSINAFVSHSLTAQMASPASVAGRQQSPSETNDAKALAETILASGLFPVPRDASLADGDRIPPPAPSLDVAKKLLLLGTVVNTESGGFAILEDLPSKKQALYRLNEMVPTVGTITQIEKDKVLFSQDAQEEWLSLAIGKLNAGFERKLSTLGQPSLARPVSAPVLPAASRSRRSIARQVLGEAAQQPLLLYQHARPVASIVKGRPQGVRLEAVNHYSFYGELGFQSNDVITRINGVEVRDPSMLASLFQYLKNERTIQIDILRNDLPKTLSIDVL